MRLSELFGRRPSAPRAAAAAADVTIYATRFCPYCIHARRLLSAKGIAFTEIDVGSHPERRAEMMEPANGAHTVPQIFVDETHVGGCDDLYALEQTGKLNALLGK